MRFTKMKRFRKEKVLRNEKCFKIRWNIFMNHNPVASKKQKIILQLVCPTCVQPFQHMRVMSVRLVIARVAQLVECWRVIPLSRFES